MRVVHVNTYDNRGGAARGTYRLHSGLRQHGVDSLMFVAEKETDDPSVFALAPSKGLPGRLARRARRTLLRRRFALYSKTRPAGLYPFSDCRTEYGRLLVQQLPHAQLLNLHWIAGFLDYGTFFNKVAQHTPVVWTLRDMNAFTGGCHYAMDCEKYTQSCGACPQLGSSKPNDLSHAIWRQKKRAFGAVPDGKFHIIVVSQWMAEEVRRSPLLGDRPVSIIPNGLDVDIFKPIDMRCARLALGIPEHDRVVLFVGPLHNKWKGFDDLREVLGREPALGDVLLLSAGHGDRNVGWNDRHLHLGYIDYDRLLAAVYSAADLLVFPSRYDNLPHTVMESMACGTPVVGYDAGGVPDMVRNDITGVLVPPGDVAALGSMIAELLEDEQRRNDMSRNCRSIAIEEYSLAIQARRYHELYQQVLERENPH